MPEITGIEESIAETINNKPISLPIWYLRGGVDISECVAAFQLKAAASLLDSYTNLANPGVHTLAPGDAPSFDTSFGQIYNGASNYLILPTVTAVAPFSIVARLTHDGTAASRTILGSALNGAFIMQLTSANKIAALKRGVVLIGTTAVSVPAADTTIAFTYDAAGNFVFYIDCVADRSGTNLQTFTNLTNRVGRIDTAEYYKNILAALAIYSIALTSDQVIAICDGAMAI